MKNHFLPVWSAVGTLAIAIPVILTVQPHSLAQNPQPPGSTANYPVINGGVDWRSVNAQNIPWSKPVIINDPFDGNYLAVFDRNYKDLQPFLHQ